MAYLQFSAYLVMVHPCLVDAALFCFTCEPTTCVSTRCIACDVNTGFRLRVSKICLTCVTGPPQELLGFNLLRPLCHRRAIAFRFRRCYLPSASLALNNTRCFPRRLKLLFESCH